MKRFLMYGVPIMFFMMFAVFMIFFAKNTERNYYKEHSDNMFNGNVIEAKPFGKGAYHYVVKAQDKDYGLTFKGVKNIIVGDSIAKSKYEPYLIYRKVNNEYVLLEKIGY